MPDTRTTYVRSGDTKLATDGGPVDLQAEAASARATASPPAIVRTPGCVIKSWRYGLTLPQNASRAYRVPSSATEGLGFQSLYGSNISAPAITTMSGRSVCRTSIVP